MMEKRHAPRIATSNFLGYLCLDDAGKEISEGYGCSINLSLTGIQMQTYRKIESRMILLLAIDINDQIIEIKGEVVYDKIDENNNWLYGINFLDSKQKQRETISNFVESYYKRDKKIMLKMQNQILKKQT